MSYSCTWTGWSERKTRGRFTRFADYGHSSCRRIRKRRSPLHSGHSSTRKRLPDSPCGLRIALSEASAQKRARQRAHRSRRVRQPVVRVAERAGQREHDAPVRHRDVGRTGAGRAARDAALDPVGPDDDNIAGWNPAKRHRRRLPCERTETPGHMRSRAARQGAAPWLHARSGNSCARVLKRHAVQLPRRMEAPGYSNAGGHRVR